MSPPTLSAFLQVGIDVLNTIVGASATSQTGTILAQLGTVGREDGSGTGEPVTETDNAEWWQHVGYASRPPNAQSGKAACQAVALRGSDRDIVIASRDIRTNSIYGNLAPGETCVFAAGPDGTGQARTLYKADGSVTHYTTDTNEAAGSAVYLRLHPTKGLMFLAPWGKLVFDQTGFHIQHASGFRFDAGGVGGIPAPLSSLASYATMRAAVVKMEGTMTLLGAGPAYSPVCWAAAENPLTTPGVPLTAIGFGAPTGQFTSASVRAGL